MAKTLVKSVRELFVLPARPLTGRGRLVDAAVELFYRHGFGAVGIDRVIASAGVTKTTFYKHFDGKDDLMVAAVQRRDEWESRALADAVRSLGGDDPAGQLLAVFEVLDLWFADPDFRGCMFMNVAAEFPDPNDPVHKAALARRRSTRDFYRDLALAAGPDAVGAETFADCYTALVEGTLILRQTHRRDDAARAVRPAAEHLVRGLLPKVRRPASGAPCSQG